jgi:hypothetical protein
MTDRQINQPGPGTTEVLHGAIWRKSSYSGTQGNCVEVATSRSGMVAVRDSKDAGGPLLVVKREAWATFIAHIKHT